MVPQHFDTALAGFGTRAVRAGLPHDPNTGAISEPIKQPEPRKFRDSNTSLERAKYAVSFASGLAALATVIQGIASKGHVVSVADLYGGTHRYLMKVADSLDISVTFTPSIEEEVDNIIQDDAKLICIESPSNPTLSMVDIRKVAEAAHKRGVLVLVDNTFLSPYLQNPLDLGADIVLHSVTKYLNGHSDVLMGVIALNSTELHKKLSFLQNAIGSVPSPFDRWLAHRGLKTLHLRVKTASQNASAIATLLSQSRHVLQVNYPGLPTHPQHHLVSKQHFLGMGGAMVSFRIHGGASAAARFCKESRLFTLAESLGGVESLCEIPAQMTHASMPLEDREKAGVFDNLIRLSIGIEDLHDLERDLLESLDRAISIG